MSFSLEVWRGFRKTSDSLVLFLYLSPKKTVRQSISSVFPQEQASPLTWEAAAGGWEVGVGAGRFWRTSSGGGTGNTTGEALEGSLLTSNTSIGPDVLFRRIWYFLCPLRIYKRTKTRHFWAATKKKKQPPMIHNPLTASGIGTSSCVPLGARMANSVSPVKNRKKVEWDEIVQKNKCPKVQVETGYLWKRCRGLHVSHRPLYECVKVLQAWKRDSPSIWEHFYNFLFEALNWKVQYLNTKNKRRLKKWYHKTKRSRLQWKLCF